jgi:hypothetical protein
MIGPSGRGQHDLIADPPAGHRLGQVDLIGSFRGGFPQLDPGAAHFRAVKVHSPCTADDCRAGLLVQSFDVVQPDDGDVLGGDRLASGANFKRRPWLIGIGGFGKVVAVKAFLAEGVVGLDLNQAGIEQGIAVARETERAGDIDRPDHRVALHVVRDRVAA